MLGDCARIPPGPGAPAPISLIRWLHREMATGYCDWAPDCPLAHVGSRTLGSFGLCLCHRDDGEVRDSNCNMQALWVKEKKQNKIKPKDIPLAKN